MGRRGRRGEGTPEEGTSGGDTVGGLEQERSYGGSGVDAPRRQKPGEEITHVKHSTRDARRVNLIFTDSFSRRPSQVGAPPPPAPPPPQRRVPLVARPRTTRLTQQRPLRTRRCRSPRTTSPGPRSSCSSTIRPPPCGSTTSRGRSERGGAAQAQSEDATDAPQRTMDAVRKCVLIGWGFISR